MNKVQEAVDAFPTQLNCSQAILTVFGEAYGLDPAMAKQLGRPLGGGMGQTARTCGAVSASVLILGLARGNGDEAEAREVAFAGVQEFFKRFEAVHGTTECRSLLGADMSTEEGKKRIQQENLVPTLCPSFVRSAAEILEGLLKS
jgi:C_GCAxxG_C_C family probable redox protein